MEGRGIKKLYAFVGSAVALLTGLHFMYGNSAQTIQQIQQSPIVQQVFQLLSSEATHLTAPPARAGETIRVASFNIQVFGQQKLSKPAVMETIVKVLRHFDVIAIQEVRSVQQNVLPQLCDMLNADGSHYAYVIGPPLGSTDSKEQYAYVFDQTSIEVDRNQLYTVNDPDDLLQREPLVGWFRVRGPPPEQAFTFTLVTMHTTPDPPARLKSELDVLDDVFFAVRDDGRQEDDVIMLGDFNANNHNLGQLGAIPGLACVIGDVRGANGKMLPITTNTRGTQQYDNILFHPSATTEFVGRGGVFDFLREYNLSEAQAIEVSDHFPVWAEFSVYEGGRPSPVATLPQDGRY